MSELKPCPMCGTIWVGFETSKDSTWVECDHCHTSSEVTHSQGAARKAWNNRPHENKIKAEAVREAFLDGAACFGVMQSTAIEAYETSDTKIKLERGE